MNSGKVLTGIIAGFAAGAAIGILFAPDKGSATRQKIADMKDDYTEDLKAKYDELRENVKDKYATAKHNAKNLAAKGKDVVNDVKDDAENLAWDAKHAANQNYNS